MRITITLALAVLAVAAIGLCGAADAQTTCCNTCGITCCDNCCDTCCDASCPAGCCHGGCHGGRKAAYRAARQAAFEDYAAARYGTYSHVGWGGPVTLVVPPTARFQTDYGWGVGNTRISPIYPQFSRQGYGVMTSYGQGAYQTTPLWPSDTTQFGVYYARGPW